MLNNFPPQRLQTRRTPTRGSQSHRITLNINIHYTLHIYTPVLLCFVQFCFALVCVSFGSRFTDSLLPKAAETLKHQTQDQLDDNITSLMGQDPSQSYIHKELAKITGSLSHTLITQVERQARCTTPAGHDTCTTTHRAAGT